jgi:HK97 family phage portal protein
MSFMSRALAVFGYEQKSNPALMQYEATGLGYGLLPQPVMMQANPKAFMKEGYRRNDTVHKCVSYIARNAAGIRLALYTDSTKKREITSHPLLDLLAKPNGDMSGNDFVESVCAYTLLIGNSYQYALRAFKSGPPDELWSLNPAMIDIVPGPRGIVRYDYKIRNPYIQLEPELVGHTKFWNPDDDLYGLSPIEIAGIFVDMNLAYRKWNLALTQNMAQPPGAWTTPALLGQKERAKLEESVNKKYNGFKNAGKAPVLDGGLKFESYAVPPAQMAFLEGQGFNGVAIANIYSLAPQIVGDTASSTYDNMEQAVYGSYTEAIFPLMDKVTGMWNRCLRPMYPDLKNAYLGYDKQSVETIQKVMQAQESAKAERWTKIWLAGGCKLAEYRDKIGLPKPKVGGDSYRIKDILIAEEDLEKYAEQCLTAPAAQTLPVPEGTPPPPGTTVEGSLAKPPALPAPKPKPAQPKKSLDANDIYQPDDLEPRLAAYEAQGVTETTWKVAKNGGCDICLPNDGVTVPLGQPFPSGHILPKAHPNCECEVIPIYGAKTRDLLPFEQKRVKRDEYQEFMRRYA